MSGITNYNASKMSVPLTTNTTEFDDELVKRGIVTMEQVMLAKGASPEEAARLVEEKKVASRPKSGIVYEIGGGNNDHSTVEKNGEEADDDSDNNDDDEFMKKYRQERLTELKLEHNAHSRVEHIIRDQWSEKVNEASQRCWVLVTMTDQPSFATIQQELYHIARQYAGFYLVTIEYTQAIPNWPPERVPTIFAYRDGIKQHEWIAPSNGKFPTQTQLHQLLLEWDVILD
jgi:hypothetical protein